MSKLYSIFIYLTAFVLSLFFTQRAEKAWRRDKRISYRLCSMIAIVVPCLVAAFRGSDVGTDTVRLVWSYENALSSETFTQYFSWMIMQDLELAFIVLNYALSRLGLTAQSLLFVFELLTILPVYYVAKKHMEDYPMWSCMTVFYAFFYNISFNATRQCIAIAFVILLYQMIVEKKYIKAVLCGAVALLFHGSAYIGIIIVLAAVVFSNIKATAIQQVGVFFLFFALAASPLYLDSIFDILANMGILSTRQSFYQALFAGERVLEGSMGLSGGGYTAIVFRIMCLVIPAVALYKKQMFRRVEVKSISVVVLMGTVLYVFCSIVLQTIHIFRITMYPEIFYILYLPYLKGTSRVRDRTQDRLTITVGTCVFVALLIAYWYLIFIKYGWHQTNYYHFVE